MVALARKFERKSPKSKLDLLVRELKLMVAVREEMKISGSIILDSISHKAEFAEKLLSIIKDG